MPRTEPIFPNVLFLLVTQHCLIHFTCCCHCILTTWAQLEKCWVLHSRIRWVVVTARCNLVWVCHKASHSNSHLKVGCPQRNSDVPCGVYYSNSIRIYCFFLFCLLAFHSQKQGWYCICAQNIMAYQTCFLNIELSRFILTHWPVIWESFTTESNGLVGSSTQKFFLKWYLL